MGEGRRVQHQQRGHLKTQPLNNMCVFVCLCACVHMFVLIRVPSQEACLVRDRGRVLSETGGVSWQRQGACLGRERRRVLAETGVSGALYLVQDEAKLVGMQRGLQGPGLIVQQPRGQTGHHCVIQHLAHLQQVV